MARATRLARSSSSGHRCGSETVNEPAGRSGGRADRDTDLCTPHWLVFLDTLAPGRTYYDSPAVISRNDRLRDRIRAGQSHAGLAPAWAAAARDWSGAVRGVRTCAATSKTSTGCLRLERGRPRRPCIWACSCRSPRPGTVCSQYHPLRGCRHDRPDGARFGARRRGRTVAIQSGPLSPDSVDDRVSDRRDTLAELRRRMARIQLDSING